jgi:hypothetical protein
MCSMVKPMYVILGTLRYSNQGKHRTPAERTAITWTTARYMLYRTSKSLASVTNGYRPFLAYQVCTGRHDRPDS